MSERDLAREAQTKMGKCGGPMRPTQAEIDADVPGARSVPAHRLPPGVVVCVPPSAEIAVPATAGPAAEEAGNPGTDSDAGGTGLPQLA